MKTLLPSLLVVAVCVMACGSPTANADGSIVIKSGSFTLSNDTQNISNSISLTFDEDASGVFDVEGEWRLGDHVAIGGELLSYSNDWVSNVGTSGDNDTLVLMFNGKRYFGPTKLVQPYIGAGIGIASVDFDGLGGSSSGEDLALQVMGGISVRRGKLGFYSELRWLSSEPEDGAGQDIDVSGTGLFAGLSFQF